MLEIDYEDLSTDFLKTINNKMLKIRFNRESFYFKLSIKKESDKLVVHSNGAVNWEKNTPPVQMRSSWGRDINAHCLFIDDKTIHESKINTGWGAGRKERFFLEDYSTISMKIQSLLGVNDEDVLYWGSSAGGFMSIILASMHKSSSAVVNNPQTLLKNHYSSKVNKMYEAVFPGLSSEEIENKYPERISVVSAMKQYGNIPKIYYFQNNKYEFDLENHYYAFIDEVNKQCINDKDFLYVLYNDSDLGHAPLPKDQTLQYLEIVLNLKQL